MGEGLKTETRSHLQSVAPALDLLQTSTLYTHYILLFFVVVFDTIVIMYHHLQWVYVFGG